MASLRKNIFVLGLVALAVGPEPSEGIAAENPARRSPATAAASAQVDACTLIPKTELERLIGWELRDGKPKDASPGMSQCEFTPPPKAYVTRRFPNPPLPEAAGFSSVVITTFPTTEKTFEESRKTMQSAAERRDLSAIGADAAFLEGPARIFVRVGNRGFSIRVHVEAPKTPPGAARLAQVMDSLAKAGVAKLRG